MATSSILLIVRNMGVKSSSDVVIVDVSVVSGASSTSLLPGYLVATFVIKTKRMSL